LIRSIASSDDVKLGRVYHVVGKVDGKELRGDFLQIGEAL